jgi:hypothetical protein
MRPVITGPKRLAIPAEADLNHPLHKLGHTGHSTLMRPTRGGGDRKDVRYGFAAIDINTCKHLLLTIDPSEQQGEYVR